MAACVTLDLDEIAEAKILDASGVIRPLLEKLALPAHTLCNIPPISAPRTRPSPVSDAGIKPEASCAKPGSCSNRQLISGFAP